MCMNIIKCEMYTKFICFYFLELQDNIFSAYTNYIVRTTDSIDFQSCRDGRRLE